MDGLLNSTPVELPDGGVVDGNVRVKRATITLASQTTSDTIVIAKAKAGESFLYGVMNNSATLGASATVAGLLKARLIFRRRPCDASPMSAPLGASATDSSSTSGHLGVMDLRHADEIDER